MPEHLTPNMILALRALAEAEEPMLPSPLGHKLDIRHTKGSYRGEKKVWGVGSAAAAIARALVRRDLAKEVLFNPRWNDEARYGWVITDEGRTALAKIEAG